MKKINLLLILFFPVLAMAQTQIKNGSIIFDMNGKKKPADTTQQQQNYNPYESDEDYLKGNSKQPKSKSKPEQTTSVHEYWRQYGLFQPIFHAGFNACQIDGDGYSGYNYLGFEGGIGARIKVHPVMSVSVEFNYSMRGAKQPHGYDSTLASSTTYTAIGQNYQVQLDYMQVPIALNIDAISVKKKSLMVLNFGLTPGVVIRFKQFDQAGDNVTSAPPEGQPHVFDLNAFGGLYFVIHQNFMLGGQFQYSITRIRGPNLNGLTRLLGEYNNDLTFDVKYILFTAKKSNRKN